MFRLRFATLNTKEALNKYTRPVFVIPAKAGIQRFQWTFWMPAFAGMTTEELVQSFPNGF
jgi:hypothetical protein